MGSGRSDRRKSPVVQSRDEPSEVARAANRARFARLVARPDADVDLALGALCVAADGRPDLDFEPTLQALDALTDRVRARLDRGDGPELTLARLHGVLYSGDRACAGPRAAEYHDVRNSQLDNVLTRRIGLPDRARRHRARGRLAAGPAAAGHRHARPLRGPSARPGRSSIRPAAAAA